MESSVTINLVRILSNFCINCDKYPANYCVFFYGSEVISVFNFVVGYLRVMRVVRSLLIAFGLLFAVKPFAWFAGRLSEFCALYYRNALFYNRFCSLGFLCSFSCVAFLVWQGSFLCFDALIMGIANSAVLVLFVARLCYFFWRFQRLFVGLRGCWKRI